MNYYVYNNYKINLGDFINLALKIFNVIKLTTLQLIETTSCSSNGLGYDNEG